MSIRDYIKEQKEKRTEHRRRKLTLDAQEFLQAKELNGDLWLTVNNFPVVPTDMLKDDIITTLGILREKFVERNL